MASTQPGTRRRGRAPGSRLGDGALILHRYVGLATAVFLVVAGVTGSVLVFYHELDAALSPRLHKAVPSGRPMLELEPLHGAVQRQLPAGLRVSHLPLSVEPRRTLRVFAAPTSRSEPRHDEEYYFDPYSGELLGSRRRGDLGQGLKNLMPFLYSLHYSLALGEVGTYLFGAVALLWTVDCFVAGYLTFPPPRRTGGAGGAWAWLTRWLPAWLLRTNKLFSFVFTWHRASGLWLWGVLFIFAWSAVGLNLSEVYRPVMTATFGMEEAPWSTLPKLPAPRHEPSLSFHQARVAGRSRMQEEAARQGFEVLEERAIGYEAESGTYEYRVRSTLDVSDRYPATTLWLDGDTGAFVAFHAPTGRVAGDTVTTWLYHLHFGSVAIGGWPYRVFVALVGLAVAALSVTGVWIWWRKRSKRRTGRLPSAEQCEA